MSNDQQRDIEAWLGPLGAWSGGELPGEGTREVGPSSSSHMKTNADRHSVVTSSNRATTTGSSAFTRPSIQPLASRICLPDFLPGRTQIQCHFRLSSSPAYSESVQHSLTPRSRNRKAQTVCSISSHSRRHRAQRQRTCPTSSTCHIAHIRRRPLPHDHQSIARSTRSLLLRSTSGTAYRRACLRARTPPARQLRRRTTARRLIPSAKAHSPGLYCQESVHCHGSQHPLGWTMR